MYEFESRVRYSEAIHNGFMNPISIANYFQDCSTFHSGSIGKDISYYREIKHAWFLNSWQIDIRRFPECGERIFIRTWAYGFKSFFGYRNFVLLDEQKEVCACANAIWFFADTATGQPARVPEEEAASYGSEEKFPMEYCPRKIILPSSMEPLNPYTVSCHDIDTNGHMNNARYLELAYGLSEELQTTETIWRVRAEYKKAAKKGDILYPYLKKETPEQTGASTHEYYISLTDKDEPCASVVFYTK